MIEMISIKSQSNWQVKLQIQNLRIKPQLRDLLNVLLSFRNPKSLYSIFPSMKKIADLYGKGRDQTRRDLKTLEDLGYIRSLDCYRKADHAQGANVYVLLKTILNPINVDLRKAVEDLKPRASKFRSVGKKAAELNEECSSPIYYEYDREGRRKTQPLELQPSHRKICNTPYGKSAIVNSVHLNQTSYNQNTANTYSVDVAADSAQRVDIKFLLELYENLFGKKLTLNAGIKFSKAYIEHGAKKDVIESALRQIASEPMLKETTFSPNRAFNLDSIRESQKFVVAAVNKITKDYGHNHDAWLNHIIHDKTLGRWHSFNEEAMARTGYWIAYGKSGDDVEPDDQTITITKSGLNEIPTDLDRTQVENRPDDIAVSIDISPDQPLMISQEGYAQNDIAADQKTRVSFGDRWRKTLEVEKLCNRIVKADCVLALRSSNIEKYDYIMEVVKSLKSNPDGIDIEALREAAKNPRDFIADD